jgi:hypothetical protein
MAMKKGTNYVQVTDDQVKESLELNNGLVEPSAKYLGVCRQTLQTRLKKNPELKKFQLECTEAMKDKATSKLIEAIDKGEPWAITFYLKTQARDRGFGDAQDINLNGSVNVTDHDLSKLSIEELKVLDELVSKSSIESTD